MIKLCLLNNLFNQDSNVFNAIEIINVNNLSILK